MDPEALKLLMQQGIEPKTMPGMPPRLANENTFDTSFVNTGGKTPVPVDRLGVSPGQIGDPAAPFVQELGPSVYASLLNLIMSNFDKAEKEKRARALSEIRKSKKKK